uniref:Uncharacterized protein n=3 Tax=Enterobacteriaceae TaxID=543 RepID=A0A023PYU8_ECOLX|nr:hypothetical protein TR4_016 [Klebsiella pneumoniae]AFO59822.1 hypothetical protein TR3_016 [Klebsiella pneumoniae]AHX39433.1 hypothetical protein ECS01_0017 [Escherichia coli]AKJ21317.1 Hypothetical protein pYNKP001-NDM_0015 [Raoultella ornithinolytica]
MAIGQLAMQVIFKTCLIVPRSPDKTTIHNLADLDLLAIVAVCIGYFDGYCRGVIFANNCSDMLFHWGLRRLPLWAVLPGGGIASR